MEITFRIGEENRPKIESIDSDIIKNSLFKEQYKYALQTFDSYLQKCDDERLAKAKKPHSGVKFNVDKRNNIFAFLGDRGSGKTSCMTSVAKFLCEPNLDVLQDYHLDNLSKHKFYPLDLIDPLFFDDKHNILSMIVAKLYHKFLDEKKERVNDHTLDVDKCRILLEKFNCTQKYLTYMLEKHEFEEDNLKELNNLSVASDLRENIHDLITCFFDCFDKSNYYLLILIDDVDLNTKEADKMTEQIRKYFIQDDAIILMSLKLDQLEQIKKLAYTNEYSNLLQKDRMSYSDIDEMVDRYLVKFIPYDQRFYMPDYEYYINSKLKIIHNQGDEDFPSIKHAVPELIFRKTRYLFYNSDIKISPIVPTNLRGLRQLIASLYEMDDYWDCAENKVSNQYNKTLFQKYLFEDWTTYNLSYEDKNKIKQIIDIRDVMTFNSLVANILIDKFYPKLKELEIASERSLEENEIIYISSSKNKNYNVSMGDVISLIGMAEKNSTSILDLNFLFVVKAICSMRLYESYDQVTAPHINENSSKNDNSTLKEILKEDQFENVTVYDECVGGRFLNTQLGGDVIPKFNNQVSRSYKCIDCSKLNDLISFCISNWNESNSDLICLAEFFMLCVSRDYSSKSKGGSEQFYDPTYRQREDISYAKSFDKGTRNVSFDINSFMFNVTRIEKCYSRFSGGEEFFELADNDREGISLWSRFKKSTIRQRHPDLNENPYDMFNYYEWLSVCSLRNVEIIQNVFKHIGTRKPQSGSDLKVLSYYFSVIGDYSINTYDRTRDGKDFYSIKFLFAQDVSDYLTSVAQDAQCRASSWFDRIYSEAIDMIDVDLIVKRTQTKGRNNKKETVLNNLRRLFPKQMSNIEFRKHVDEEFSGLDERLSREEIRNALMNINARL